MKNLLLSLIVLMSVQTTIAANDNYQEFDVSVDLTYSNESLDERLMIMEQPKLATFDDLIRRKRNISNAIFKLNDKQALLMRNLIGYSKHINAAESKKLILSKWRNDNFGMTSVATLSLYESVLGKVLLDN